LVLPVGGGELAPSGSGVCAVPERNTAVVDQQFHAAAQQLIHHCHPARPTDALPAVKHSGPRGRASVVSRLRRGTRLSGLVTQRASHGPAPGALSPISSRPARHSHASPRSRHAHASLQHSSHTTRWFIITHRQAPAADIVQGIRAAVRARHPSQYHACAARGVASGPPVASRELVDRPSSTGSSVISPAHPLVSSAQLISPSRELDREELLGELLDGHQ